MRIMILDLTTDTAMVERRPGWLRRAFGARVTRTRLCKLHDQIFGRAYPSWVYEATGRALSGSTSSRDEAILQALEHQVVACLPVARLQSVAGGHP